MRALISMVVACSLTGCATEQLVGKGVVQKHMLIKKEDVAAAVGRASSDIAKKGATTGAISGATVGLATGPFAIIVSPVLAVVGGVSGAIVGGSGGALYGYSKSAHQFLYSYAVHSDTNGKMYLVHQYDKAAIADRTPVKIYLGNHKVYHIEPIANNNA